MRVIVYELPIRLFTNTCSRRVPRGTLGQNGAGKFNEVNDAALEAIRGLGATHIWLVGALRQATLTSHPGIPSDPPDVVKGVAGSYFAIRDYFDVCPDYAESVPNRMLEFAALVDRIHSHGMKVLLDLVPNHVARTYHSMVRPELDFGLQDDKSKFFAPSNDFFYLVEPAEQRLRIAVAPGWHVGGMSGGFSLEDGKEGRTPRASGNNQTSPNLGPNDWHDVVKLNYGYNFVTGETRFDPIPGTWWKMDEVISYWQGKGVDGFRCDFAHWVPIEFWTFAISRARSRNAAAYFMAEAFDNSDAVPGYSKAALIGAGFDSVYDEPGFRTAKRIAQGVGWANDLDILLDGGELGKHLVRYTENHDERRAASAIVREGEPRNSGFGSARAGLAFSQALWLAGTGPILVYAGQESGEEGNDQEGYSGHDGRTTIFDYWALPRLMAWSNAGRWDGAQSSWAERQCRRGYSKLLATARRPEFAHGGCYGLNYMTRADRSCENQGRWVWSHLRYGVRGASLSVVNLSPRDSCETQVRIPREAQRLAGWPESATLNFEPLLESSDHMSIGVSELSDAGVHIVRPALSGEVYSISVRGG